ncbi:autotransporter outer membrane beta-barrel domain-containing protein, partial [Fusobacterium sp. THCT1E2]
MIEQLMKAVKRGNKKRGINITIGAVIGFLLSYTTVMGTDDNYLWIKGENGIKFSTDTTDGTGGNWSSDNRYNDENIWNVNTETYINNMALSSSKNNGTYSETYSETRSYGLRLSKDLNDLQFINNGSITGKGSYYNYGIFNYNSIETLTNRGLIAGIADDAGTGIEGYDSTIITNLTNSGLITGTAINIDSYGIGIKMGSIGILANNGLIIGTGHYGYGIEADIEILTNRGLIAGIESSSSAGIFSKIEILTNRGLIAGIGDDFGIGISNNHGTTTALINSGLIIGTGSSVGCGIENSGTIEGTLTNTGVIYGKISAISNSGNINSAYNYGIIANGTEGEPVVLDATVTNADFDDNNDTTISNDQMLNRGLIFTALGTGVYKAETEDYEQFGTIHKDKELIVGYEKNNDGTLNLNNPIKESYTVINAKEKEGSSESNITGTESLTLEDGKLTYYDSEETSYKEESISLDKKYILNGITDTLKVAGTGNELNNSAVNAYKTA